MFRKSSTILKEGFMIRNSHVEYLSVILACLSMRYFSVSSPLYSSSPIQCRPATTILKERFMIINSHVECLLVILV